MELTQLEAEAMVRNNVKFACPSCKGMDKKQENHCPICLHSSPSINAMWQHIHCVHASCSEFPPIQQYHIMTIVSSALCATGPIIKDSLDRDARQLLDSRCGPQSESNSLSPDEDMQLHLALQAVESLQFDKDY